jgi:hypothetical protein
MKINRFGVFCAGAFFATVVLMFAQDLMGMERYLAWARDGWLHMNPLWWTPLIAITSYLGVRAKFYIGPNETVYLGNDGKPYEITPIKPEKETRV